MLTANLLRKAATLCLTLALTGAVAVGVRCQETPAGTEARNKTIAEISQLHQQAFEQEQGNHLDQALELYRRALEQAEKQLGPQDVYVAFSLSHLARLYGKKEDGPQAEAALDRALPIFEQTLGKENFFVATTLSSLADLYHQKGDEGRAEATYQRALAIGEKAKGADDPALVNLLTRFAGFYEDRSDDTHARPLLERALAVAEHEPKPEWRSLYFDLLLSKLALLSERAKDYEGAARFYERQLQLRETTGGAESLTVAASLEDLGRLATLRRDYARAEQLLKRALSIREKTPGGEPADLALSLTALARLYRAMGNIRQAEPLLLRALDVREKALGADHPYTSATVNELAIFYDQTGDYERAEALYLRALASKEKSVGPEHPQVATVLYNLATLYRLKGDYVRAETLLQRALLIREAKLGAESRDVAETLNNLGMVAFEKGDVERAAELYRRALAIYEKTPGPEDESLAAVLNNLAIYHQERKEFGRAEELLQRALRIYEQRLGPEQLGVATALDNLSVLYHDMNDGRAEQFVRRALEIRERQLGADHPDVAKALNNLAAILEARGDYAGAEPLYRRALSAGEKTLGAKHPNVAGFTNNLATMLWARGDLKQTITLLAQSADVREHNLDYLLTTGSEEQKRLYLKTLAGETDVLISLHLGSAPDDASALHLALETILRRKGRALDAMSDQIAALRRRLNEEDRKLLDQLAAARSALARLALDGPGQTPPEQYRSEMSRLEAEAQRLEAAVSARSAEFRVQSESPTLERIQALIPTEAALVELIMYRPFDVKAKVGQRFGPARYAAYLLRREGAPGWVDLGEAAAIDSLIARLRTALGDSESTNVKAVARALDEKVMRPVRLLLGETRMVLLSPDGALNLVPFGALVDEQNRYLVERYSFTYLTSGRDLLRMQSHAEGRQGPLVLANPQFDGAALRSGGASVKPAPQPSAGRRSVDLKGVKFKALPGTAAEARALSTILPDARVLTGRQASEAELKRADGPGVLHVATHGFFLPDQPSGPPSRRGLATAFDRQAGGREGGENPLLRSGLALAGANERVEGAEEDGVLTALEASTLNLRGTKLVVLSACETGIGEVRNGDGVFGLRRALVLAGAESQLMSLWQVADAATRDLMIEYYRALKAGAGRTEALRRVQLRMLRSRDLNHPYYWASFIPAGDWRRMDGQEPPAR